MLVDHFLDKYNRENGKNVTKISRGVLDHLSGVRLAGKRARVGELHRACRRDEPGQPVSASLLPAEVLTGAIGRRPRHRGIGSGRHQGRAFRCFSNAITGRQMPPLRRGRDSTA